VLAAGAGTRFGGGKLTARIDGQSLLGHVLDALEVAGLPSPIVVVGPATPDPDTAARGHLVTNPDPSRGLSSSLQIGWAAALAGEPQPDAVIVALGDQPLLRPEVVAALAAEPLDPERPFVAVRHADGPAPNPVRVERTAADAIAAASGDRGLGPILATQPDRVRWIDVPGANPDVDTGADLASVSELAWASRVRRNREQVDEFREQPDGRDFYGPVSTLFRGDPDRAGDPVLDALRERARPGDTWLDIGAGAGRYALPMARSVRRVLAVDPSPTMLDALRGDAAAHGIANVEAISGRWPEAASLPPLGPSRAAVADVALIAHVSYDIEAIWPFVEAMELAARRECLAVLMDRSPASLAEPFWPEVHGVARVALPALPAFVDLLVAHGRSPQVRMLEATRRRWQDRDELVAHLRRQTWVAPGSDKDRRLHAAVDARLARDEDGRVRLADAEPLTVGLVAWQRG
jgi:CTP:molybdopterin cytidylyltransferase MocA/SAM-dependent methyltransferase